MADRSKEQMDAVLRMIGRLDAGAKSVAEKIVREIGTENPARLRSALIEVLMPVCKAGSEISANAAAAIYSEWRAEDIGEAAETVVDSSFSESGFISAINKATKEAEETADASRVLSVLNERIGYDSRASYSETLFANARNDTKKPRFARVPRGLETCKFCLMLAGKGFHYPDGKSGEKVHNHDNCQCVYVASWEKSPRAERYNPKEYENQYKRLVNAKVIGRNVYDHGKSGIERELAKIDKERKPAFNVYDKSDKVKTWEAMRAVIRKYCGSKSDIEPGTKVSSDEIQIGSWLSKTGIDMRFRNPDEHKKSADGNTSDIEIRGEVWDIKRIKSSNPNKIAQNIFRKKKQGPNFVIDLSLSEMPTDVAEAKIASILNDDRVNSVMLIKNGRIKLFEK